jgi:hypothetical protein
MDLCAAEKLNGKLWHWARRGAFLCFLVACALLGASLVLPGARLAEGYKAAAGIAPASGMD